MQHKGFRQLIVWQKAHEFFFDVVKDCSEFPKNYIARGIQDNLIRAANSISVNIAEGSERKTSGEFRQFLGISKGSTGECVDQYLKIKRLGWISEEKAELRLSTLEEIDKMLRSLMYKLKK